MQIPYTVAARPDTGLNNGKIAIWLFLAIRYQRGFALAVLSIGLLLTFLLGWRLPRVLAPTLQPVNYSFFIQLL
jgi:hypothetical protein